MSVIIRENHNTVTMLQKCHNSKMGLFELCLPFFVAYILLPITARYSDNGSDQVEHTVNKTTRNQVKYVFAKWLLDLIEPEIFL